MKHNQTVSHIKQSGVVLVISLLLLLVLTIIGIASLSSVSMQEKMTANAHAQARAFEAASAGVSNALAFRDFALDTSGLDCKFTGGRDWFWPTDGFHPTNVAFGEAGNTGEVRLSQRLYCLNYGNLAVGFSGRELFVLSRGEVYAGGAPISTRDIEVRVDRVGVPTGPVCNATPWCFPLKDDLTLDENCGEPSSSEFCTCNFGAGTGNDPSTNPFSAANSNFRVVGQEFPDNGVGPSVTLPPNALLAFQCSIAGNETVDSCEANNLQTAGCQRLENYPGGFEATTDFGSPWSNPSDTYDFASELIAASGQNGMFFADPDLNIAERDLFPPDFPSLTNVADSVSSNSSVTYGPWTQNPGGISYAGFNSSGNFDFGDGIHYIAGDASFGGTIEGSGILVVEGRMDWSGGNQFDGLIVVLGGEVTISGGGSGGDDGGAVVVLDLETKPSEGIWTGSPPPPTFGDTFQVDVGGGGGAEFSYNCSNLWEAYDLVYTGRNADDFSHTGSLWEPNCDPNATEAPGGTKTVIVSWRENIGWRSGEEFPGAQ